MAGYKGYTQDELKKEAEKLGVSGPSAEAYAARSLDKKEKSSSSSSSSSNQVPEYVPPVVPTKEQRTIYHVDDTGKVDKSYVAPAPVYGGFNKSAKNINQMQNMTTEEKLSQIGNAGVKEAKVFTIEDKEIIGKEIEKPRFNFSKGRLEVDYVDSFGKKRTANLRSMTPEEMQEYRYQNTDNATLIERAGKGDEVAIRELSRRDPDLLKRVRELKVEKEYIDKNYFNKNKGKQSKPKTQTQDRSRIPSVTTVSYTPSIDNHRSTAKRPNSDSYNPLSSVFPNQPTEIVNTLKDKADKKEDLFYQDGAYVNPYTGSPDQISNVDFLTMSPPTNVYRAAEGKEKRNIFNEFKSGFKSGTSITHGFINQPFTDTTSDKFYLEQRERQRLIQGNSIYSLGESGFWKEKSRQAGFVIGSIFGVASHSPEAYSQASYYLSPKVLNSQKAMNVFEKVSPVLDPVVKTAVTYQASNFALDIASGKDADFASLVRLYAGYTGGSEGVRDYLKDNSGNFKVRTELRKTTENKELWNIQDDLKSSSGYSSSTVGTGKLELSYKGNTITKRPLDLTSTSQTSVIKTPYGNQLVQQSDSILS